MKKRRLDTGLSLEDVMGLERSALVGHWASLFNAAPPKQLHSEFLRQAIGWQVQVQVYGGLDSKSYRLLRSGLATEVLLPGTQLIRQWNGQRHQVTVLVRGYAYLGKTYGSLSAIARVITGTSWNGLVFFGVKK